MPMQCQRRAHSLPALLRKNLWRSISATELALCRPSRPGWQACHCLLQT